jgi:cytochrome c oxidase subunit IV
MSTHAEAAGSHGYKGYWILWVILLVLTVTMIVIGEADMSKVPQAALLLIGSSLKASLIIFYYMHLRLENRNLVLVVLIGIFLTGVLMFLIPAYDGTHILEHRLYQ